MIKENVALDTSQEGPCLDFFMESGSVSGIISVVHVMSWTTTIIITLGSLYFSQIHFEDLEVWSLVHVEQHKCPYELYLIDQKTHQVKIGQ